MSAELLRRAATKIRETAQPVSSEAYPFKVEPTYMQIGEHVGAFEKSVQAAAFVNLWSPDVALIIAGWLDDSGRELAESGSLSSCDSPGTIQEHITLARRILGEDA